MSRDTAEIITAGLVAIGLLTAVVIILVYIAYIFDSNISCPSFGASVDRPVRYNFWGGGCFVQDTNGQWVQTGNYWNNTERKQ
jgi:hypothetical protein